ncbi:MULTISPECIES: hypothetical protein [unclassified Dyella]|uniref:hypothetical protein n=1 Tax=unclassified Dyella TaxID=2634549 RepID=UPI000C81E1B0|nr:MULTISPECIES: hypothetical protein [unclassified Dyella]MDR3446350.1 hypothetical protein [Dyella sp.]
MTDLLGGLFHQGIKMAVALLLVVLWVLFVVFVDVAGKAWMRNAPGNPKRAAFLIAVFLTCFGSVIAFAPLAYWLDSGSVIASTTLGSWLHKATWPVVVLVGVAVGFREVRRLAAVRALNKRTTG